MKIYCFEMGKESYPFYEAKANEYGFELIKKDGTLNEKTMRIIPKGTEGVLVATNSNINKIVLEYLKSMGVKYIATASAGFEQFDLVAAKDLSYKVGRVPAYSPTSVASWTFTVGLDFLKKTNLMFSRAVNYNFTVDQSLMSQEYQDLTIGILGTGRIGYETAKYFHAIGAKVLGYDLYPNKKAKAVLTYVDLDTLLKKSDLIAIHMNHIKGENDNFINQEMIAKMKDGASIVNAARAALVDLKAIEKGIKSNKLFGFATDVITNEDQIFGKQLTETQLMKLNPELNEILKLYPRVLVSPHVAYFTSESVKNIAETSMLNFKQLKETGTCETSLT